MEKKMESFPQLIGYFQGRLNALTHILEIRNRDVQDKQVQFVIDQLNKTIEESEQHWRDIQDHRMKQAVADVIEKTKAFTSI